MSSQMSTDISKFPYIILLIFYKIKNTNKINLTEYVHTLFNEHQTILRKIIKLLKVLRIM